MLRAAPRAPAPRLQSRPIAMALPFGIKLPQLPTLPQGGRSEERRAAKKAELLASFKGTRRGLTASPEQKQQIEALASELERLNPTPQPLAAADLLSGQWELLYTTSDSILGTKKPPFLRPGGPIYQIIDAVALTARNRETWPLFNQVFATLEPVDKSKVAVQFREFKLGGLLPVQAPASARGKLDITYLDDELRVSRGNAGNLFVLRMDDRSVRP